MDKKAVIIELGSSHEECFYSQILFLKSAGYKIDLLCCSSLKGRVENFPPDINRFFFEFRRSAYKDFKNLLLIRRFIIKNKISKVILNSAHGIQVRNLMLLPYPGKVEFIGIVHDAGKILNSSNQRFINRKIKKYFVLSDNVLDYVRSIKIKDKTYESLYTIFQPEYSVEISKRENDFWVCIPGRIEQKRRDYNSLLKNLSEVKLNGEVKIILLGRIDDKFRVQLNSIIEKLNLAEKIILFEKFIPNELFYSYLKKSDLILPLIHPADVWFNKYFRTQISGSYNMAFTYRIPMLCEKSFADYEDFRDTSFFYETENLIRKINELSHERDYFISSKEKMYRLPKWNYEFQFKKYINFIER